jgi:hypothetical protein
MTSIDRGRTRTLEQLVNCTTPDRDAMSLYQRLGKHRGVVSSKASALLLFYSGRHQVSRQDLRSLLQHFKLIGQVAKMAGIGTVGELHPMSAEEVEALDVGCRSVALMGRRERLKQEEARRSMESLTRPFTTESWCIRRTYLCMSLPLPAIHQVQHGLHVQLRARTTLLQTRLELRLSHQCLRLQNLRMLQRKLHRKIPSRCRNVL